KVIYQSDPKSAPAVLASSDASANLLGLGIEEFNSVLRDEQGRAPLAPRRRTGQLTVRVIKSTGSDPVASSAQVAEDAGAWKLLLNHRDGSLDAVVQSLRRRNLTVSFGILLLLGLSVLMMIVSTRRAQRLARQQMEFVAGVSHELRTPLAVICSAGENLADGVIADRSQIERYGSLIQKEGRRLSELVEQALEFAGIQSGRKAYDLRPVAVAEIIERAVADCHRLLDERGCRVEREIEPGLPPVSGDSAALGRVVQNLIGNAIKYGGSDGWIGVKARRSTADRAGEIEIRVEDRGQGIESADLPHIFEPFYRGSKAVAAQVPGSGLGLSLVRHIVKAHGGRVSVESLERDGDARGTAFIVHLPATSPGAQDAEAGIDSAHTVRATQEP
ncbi:MAG TPA: ATP-binding protein, partial [Blastocatellia bacterium]|nr:ATP-binding protein [Blastocatellia bacterium]